MDIENVICIFGVQELKYCYLLENDGIGDWYIEKNNLDLEKSIMFYVIFKIQIFLMLCNLKGDLFESKRRVVEDGRRDGDWE